MRTLKFKTNIKCAGCIAAVTPHLDSLEEVKDHWNVDIANPDKILTVNSEKVKPETIKKTLETAGYKAEEVQ